MHVPPLILTVNIVQQSRCNFENINLLQEKKFVLSNRFNFVCDVCVCVCKYLLYSVHKHIYVGLLLNYLQLIYLTALTKNFLIN